MNDRIVFLSSKGGVGTSAIVAGIAVSRLQKNEKVLIIDFGGDIPAIFCEKNDPSYGITEWLNTSQTFEINSIINMMIEPVENLKIIPKGSSLVRSLESFNSLGILDEYFDDFTILYDLSNLDYINSRYFKNIKSVLVTSNCYFSLRRAVSLVEKYNFDNCVFVEKNRSQIVEKHLRNIIAIKNISTIEGNNLVSKTLEAGIFYSRAPKKFIEECEKIYTLTLEKENNNV